jgi:hypothetical protein
MRLFLFLAPICLLILGCQTSKREGQVSNQKIDSATISASNTNSRSSFHSIWGIDSIVKSNYVFVDSVIDSISISRHVFKAMYLSAWKGMSYIQYFHMLKASNPVEYNAITNINTAHLLLIDGREYLFNGKGDITGSKQIPESTTVVVDASIYSLYSQGTVLGKYVILDSIKKQDGTIRNQKPPE